MGLRAVAHQPPAASIVEAQIICQKVIAVIGWYGLLRSRLARPHAVNGEEVSQKLVGHDQLAEVVEEGEVGEPAVLAQCVGVDQKATEQESGDCARVKVRKGER